MIKIKTGVSDELITRVLFEAYECIYDIDAETGAYRICHQSCSYQELGLKQKGENFFSALFSDVEQIVAEEDKTYVLQMLQKDALIKELQTNKYYPLIYRIRIGGKEVYHRLTATLLYAEEEPHILMGIQNVDLMVRQEMERRRELELCRLRNSARQIQPHFLYNVLASIQEVILQDPQRASDLLGDFATHLRLCVRAIEKDEPIPFEQELDNIKAYINIEQMRFGEKLKVEYNIQAKDFLIVPLSVQPIVENAIRHGIYERGKKGGTVRIHTWEEESAWIIRVEDDGVGFNPCVETEQDGRDDADLRNPHCRTGLKNIRFRLDKLMRADMEIISVPGEGTSVTVKIPKEKTIESNNR